MRTRSSSNTQRHRGQLGGVSWAAGTLVSLGEGLVVGLLVLGSLAPTAASATSRRATADPAPQKAPPAPASRSTTPDPPPQAVAVQHRTAPRASSTQGSSPQSSSTRVPAIARPVGTKIVPRTSPAERNRAPSPHAAATSTSSGTVSTAAPHHHPRASRSAAQLRAAPRVRPTKPASVSHWVPFTSLPKALLGLPRAASQAVAHTHHDGVMLLLSSLAMAALAAASFTMLRRLMRLAGRPL